METISQSKSQKVKRSRKREKKETNAKGEGEGRTEGLDLVLVESAGFVQVAHPNLHVSSCVGLEKSPNNISHQKERKKDQQTRRE